MSQPTIADLPQAELETAVALSREIAQRKTREAIEAGARLAAFEQEMVRRQLPPHPSLEGLLQTLEKLPREPFSPGAFFNEAGDMLEVFWKSAARIAEWKNHLITLHREVREDGSDGEVIGVSVHGVTALLARPDTWITPDPANPTREVQAAQKEGVCRCCGETPGAGPGMPFVMDRGEEYAHQVCIEAARKKSTREQVLGLLPRGPQPIEIAAMRHESVVDFFVQLATHFEDVGAFREYRKMLDAAAPRPKKAEGA